MITHIESWLDLEKKDDLEVTYWRYLALNLLKQIAKINTNLFKTVIDKSEFSAFIEYIFSTDRKNLNERDKKTRSEWINLLKNYYPE